MNKGQNYYEILNLKRGCTADEIKKSFIVLSKIHHPDKNNNTKDAHEKFVIINEAYSTLNNPYKRNLYDLYLDNSRRVEFKSDVRYNYRPHSYNNDPWRTYDYKTSQSQRNRYKSNFARDILYKFIILPKVVMGLAVLFLTMFTGGAGFLLQYNNYRAKAREAEYKSYLLSVLLEQTKEQAKHRGHEEQMERLKRGCLGLDGNSVLNEDMKKK